MRHSSVILRQAVMQASPDLIMPMPICYARVIASGLGLNAADCAELLLGSGLSSADLEADERVVGFRQQRQIIVNALRISGDPALGLRIGSMTPLPTHGALSYAAVSSADLGAAFDVILRYSQTRAGFFRFSGQRQGGEMLIAIDEMTDLGPVRCFLHEVLMLTLQAVLDTVIGPRVAGPAIEFSYPAPAYLQQYHEVFHLPLQFSRPATVLRIPVALLSTRSITADAGALRAAERQCARELQALQVQASFAAQVQAAVADHLERGCSMAVIARLFRISARTLVRRLAQEETSYRLILDQVRKQQARRLLCDPAMPIGAIAQRLGYQDPSNFGRACRAWFRLSPSAFRAQQSGSEPSDASPAVAEH
jgi:AraC-like DNA-binding protein